MSDPTRSLELVRLAQGGNPHALDRLLQRYQDRILRIIRLKIGPRLRLRYTSEDVLQETLIQAIQDFDRFEVRSERSLLLWLTRLAERRILVLVRHMEAERRNPDREVPAGGGENGSTLRGPVLEASSIPPDDKVIAREQHDRLEEFLHELSEVHRDVILHRDFLELGWDEVAEATGRPSADAARMMYVQAMRELSQRFRHSSAP